MNVVNGIIGTSMGTLVASGMARKYLLSKVENINDTILKEFPKTTVLLPTLNEEWMIEKTLQSIKYQNIYQKYPDKFEILLVDSNSEDNTINIAKNYVDKIITMPERNLVLARTNGINNSKGDIIVFIDADVIYPVNWLNSMLKHYENQSVVAVSGQELNPSYGIERDIFEPLLIIAGIKKSSLMVGHNSSCYKWAFNMVDGFNVPFDYDIKSPEDTILVLETGFAAKLSGVGTYIYDKKLIIYHYGLTRRNLYNNRKKLCGVESVKENKYLCQYWNEREKGIRF